MRVSFRENVLRKCYEVALHIVNVTHRERHKQQHKQRPCNAAWY